MPALSIIVPVYNVEKYLPRCLDSILNQTFEDFELILVNDGSTDGSLRILRQYEQKDRRVLVLDNKNSGVSAARNSGLKVASGKYVGIIDSDDWIDSDMYEKMIESLEASCCDIACCKVAVVEEKTGNISFCDSSLPPILSGEDFMAHIFGLPESVLTSSCNKLYIRDNIKEYFDENIRMDEDTKFLVHYCLNVKKASFIDSVSYYYNRHVGSFTMSDTKNIIKGLFIRRKIAEELLEFSIKAHENAERSYLDRCCIGIAITKGDRKSCEYKIARSELLTYLKKNMIMVLKNKNMTWKLKVVVLFRATQALFLK